MGIFHVFKIVEIVPNRAISITDEYVTEKWSDSITEE